MKGQFFLLGAIVLCVMFFLALPSVSTMNTSDMSDLSALSENLEKELPMALNLAMEEDNSPAKLNNFIDFLKTRTSERYLSLEILDVVAVPDPDNPGDIDVYAGNWLGRAVTLKITVESTEITLNLNDGETDSRSFSGLGSDIDVKIRFEDRIISAQSSRDKTNLYAYMKLSRGENSIVKEIIA